MTIGRQLELFPPKAGQQIFFPSTDYNTPGLGTVGRVEHSISAGKEVPFVTCKEAPGMLFNWEILEQKQKWLKGSFGSCQVRPC